MNPAMLAMLAMLEQLSECCHVDIIRPVGGPLLMSDVFSVKMRIYLTSVSSM